MVGDGERCGASVQSSSIAILCQYIIFLRRSVHSLAAACLQIRCVHGLAILLTAWVYVRVGAIQMMTHTTPLYLPTQHRETLPGPFAGGRSGWGRRTWRRLASCAKRGEASSAWPPARLLRLASCTCRASCVPTCTARRARVYALRDG